MNVKKHNINRFSTNLYQLMKERKVTKESLADELDVSTRAVYFWQSGQRCPSYDQLIKIAKILSTSIDGLLI
ncbi:MAG: helix-turn-helix transcriptional regulator [Bacilli bacterium]|nr:helix-turn-helix transcriptional regulator [Bacilli bacterium]